MSQTVLVTGGYGFLGRAVARQFKNAGYRVVGIGHGRWSPEEAVAQGFDSWLDAGVSLSSLMTLNERFDLVAHCAGNGSVGYSITHPLEDFYKTVQGTADLLEFLRLAHSTALLVYPSSAAVYGAKPDEPILENTGLNPISPYGFHKKIVEELLQSYSRSFGIRVAIIRFFSIYGPGLTKQLLWEASTKLMSREQGPASFWGTGGETRDWISGEDAAGLFMAARQCPEPYNILNGAGGVRTTVRQTVELLRSALKAEREIVFNNTVRDGDPRFYHADISRAESLGWRPTVPFAQGVERYAAWFSRFRGLES